MMHTRRLVKAGQSSHTVSLPNEWVKKHSLKKGDIVYINESDLDLLITPEPKEQSSRKDITINLDNKDISKIQREITSAYINNHSTITILGKDINKRSKEIRKILHDFVALEIAEQTSTRIVAKDLLNPKEISIEKTIRRMDMMIRSIMQDSISSIGDKSMYESITYRDFDINRLYFLMFRILKGALADIKIAQSYGIKNTQTLSLWYLVVNLENLADNLKNSCRLFESLKKIDPEGLKELLKELEHSYLDVIKAYYNKDKDLAHKVASGRNAVMEKCSDYYEKNRSKELFEIMGNFKELQTFICNIARIVIDD